MRISIIFCHYKTSKMSAYAVSQLLKLKGKHEIDILICDNNSGDGSIDSLKPFSDSVRVFDYPKDKIQTHGVGYDFLIPHINTEYFITMESDSFPTKDNWIDYYEELINLGYEWGGSLLKLSGGEFIHPTGAFFKRSLWEEAKKYCDAIEYNYFPNMSVKEEFECHLMVHNRALKMLLEDPEDFIDLAKGYKGLTKEEMIVKMEHYKPIANGVFHNGMGNSQESIKTYQQRNITTEPPHILLDNKQPLIHRIGMEPGQFLCYYLIAKKEPCFVIPTNIKWMPNRGQQQQEYTIMENGFKHLWSVSAYFGNTNPELQDIVTFKTKVVDDLYNSLPENQKVNL